MASRKQKLWDDELQPLLKEMVGQGHKYIVTKDFIYWITDLSKGISRHDYERVRETDMRELIAEIGRIKEGKGFEITSRLKAYIKLCQLQIDIRQQGHEYILIDDNEELSGKKLLSIYKPESISWHSEDWMTELWINKRLNTIKKAVEKGLPDEPITEENYEEVEDKLSDITADILVQEHINEQGKGNESLDPEQIETIKTALNEYQQNQKDFTSKDDFESKEQAEQIRDAAKAYIKEVESKELASGCAQFIVGAIIVIGIIIIAGQCSAV